MTGAAWVAVVVQACIAMQLANARDDHGAVCTALMEGDEVNKRRCSCGAHTNFASTFLPSELSAVKPGQGFGETESTGIARACLC